MFNKKGLQIKYKLKKYTVNCVAFWVLFIYLFFINFVKTESSLDKRFKKQKTNFSKKVIRKRDIGSEDYFSFNKELSQRLSNFYKDKKVVKKLFAKEFLSGFVAVTFVFLALITSKYYTVPFIEAETVAQSFSESKSLVEKGITFLKYEVRSEEKVESTEDFNGGNYSFNNFEGGENDLVSITDGDDFLTLNHYGDNAPDISEIDWWDDDNDSTTNYNWRYRKCFDIDHSDSDAKDLTEYQIYLDINTETLVSQNKMNSDGDDLRFIDSDNNTLDHFVADDMNEGSTRIWVKMDNVESDSVEKICMYYGNNSAVNIASREDVFTYDNQESIYYVVADTAEKTIADFVSYSDDNNVSVAEYSDNLNEYESDHYPNTSFSLEQTTAISTTDPINGAYGIDGSDALVPATFAGENFVYRMDRYTNYFSFVSPWCDAEVEVRNSKNNIVNDGSFTISAGASHNLKTNNDSNTGLSDDDTVIIEVTNGCSILAQHHGSSGGDSFVMIPAATEWYGVGSGHFGFAALQDDTNITVYKSNNTSVNYKINRGENIDINDAGSEGSDPAHRVLADKPIGVSALADSDGGDATTFLPVNEMGYLYYISESVQYISIATKEGLNTNVGLYYDGTKCGVGAPDETLNIVASANYPGKGYFGSTVDGENILAGACLVADNSIFTYYEYSITNDEHNAWNEKQNRQFVSPKPTYVIGNEEIGTWDIDGINTWIRRTPVTVSNLSVSKLTDYQINIDLNSDFNNIFGRSQVDGGDVRVAGDLGDGTDNITYALENFDGPNAKGNLWIKVPSISAVDTTTFYIYYNVGMDVLNANPLLWLDAADSPTITETIGSVSQWSDKSTNLIPFPTNHLTSFSFFAKITM